MRLFDSLLNPAAVRSAKSRSSRQPSAFRVRIPSRWLSRSRQEEGVALVEFAFVLSLFLLLVFALIDFGHLFFVKMAVQNAVQEAARYGSTGNHLPDPNNPGNYLSRITSIENTLQNDAMGVNISNISVSSVNLAGVSSSTSAGGPGDMLTVTANVNMPLLTPVIARLFPNGQFSFVSSVTVMNEPFQPSQTD